MFGRAAITLGICPHSSINLVPHNTRKHSHYWNLRFVKITNNHKPNHDEFKSIPNQIMCFHIKSYLVNSNHHMWCCRDLNQIVIWIYPSLVDGSIKSPFRIWWEITNFVKLAWITACSLVKTIPGSTETLEQTDRQTDRQREREYPVYCARQDAPDDKRLISNVCLRETARRQRLRPKSTCWNSCGFVVELLYNKLFKFVSSDSK